MRNPLRPLFVVWIAVLVAACSTAASTATFGASHSASDSTQTSDWASVTIDVTWAGPDTGAVFEVKMDNHMIDLSSVDLTAATLTNDRGEKLSRPTWEGGTSGHHREGQLSFGASPAGSSPAGASPAGASPAGASPAGASSAALFADASWVQLELPAEGDSSPRDFKWALSK